MRFEPERVEDRERMPRTFAFVAGMDGCARGVGTVGEATDSAEDEVTVGEGVSLGGGL